MVKLKWEGKKSSSKCHRNLVAGVRGSSSSHPGPGGTSPTTACSCTTSSHCSLTGNGVPWVSLTLAMYRWSRFSPVVLGRVVAKVQRVLWKEMGTEVHSSASTSSRDFRGTCYALACMCTWSDKWIRWGLKGIVWFWWNHPTKQVNASGHSLDGLNY